MKKKLLLLRLLGTLAVPLGLATAQELNAASLIDPALRGFASQRESTQKAHIVLLVRGNGQGIATPQRYDRAGVVRYYQQISKQAIGPVIQSIQTHQLEGVEIKKVYWINAAIVADVTPAGLMALAHHPAVTKIYAERALGNDPGRPGGP